VNTGNKRNADIRDSRKALSPGKGWGEVSVNCDMGEGTGNDELIMPFITSANIACGYHAGNVSTMQQTVELCLKHHVAIGAHPSFLDRENFGRSEMNLPAGELYDLLTQQLIIFTEVADACGAKIHHVKPHGALYNMSARDAGIAIVIAKAVKDFDNSLVLLGQSGSHSISEAKKLGLTTASEVFADRTYRDDGSLIPRSQPGALIEETGKAVAQVLQMIREGAVTTVSGKIIPVLAETICIHSDGKHAAEFAEAIHAAIKAE
jgi:UPF0271 protein